MKCVLILLICFTSFIVEAQPALQNNFSLTVSPLIDSTDKINRLIIKSVAAFLSTKNTSVIDNKYWLPADYEKYMYPYLDIYNIEDSKFGKRFYQPTLMEIIPTGAPLRKIIKIAFIGHNQSSNENQLKVIYNIIANVIGDEIQFSRYLDHGTQTWANINRKSVTYKIPVNRKINEKQVRQQLQDIETICRFFSCEPIPVTYYSCANVKQVFEIKGFDYHPMMYSNVTGGLADFGNIIFSGNNAEIYTHEVVHIYTKKLFPQINSFIDEGLATYIAGSGKFDYAWHRIQFEKFLTQNNTYDPAEHMDPYESIYYNKETSAPYVAAALILERTMRVFGKAKLIALLQSRSELWETLKTVGLTKENLNTELRRESKLPVTLLWKSRRSQ